MKLADLNPRFFALEHGGQPVGLSFDCPHCGVARIAIYFHREGKAAIQDAYIHAKSPDTNHIWTITGNSFEDFSLSPSIDASASGHWHGFVTNGSVS